MKKILFLLGACSLMALASCSGNKAQQTQEAEEAQPETEVVAQAAEEVVDPYIANLMQSDSTVMVTPSGLGYKIIKQTRGVTPDPTATVSVKYIGKHTDGSVFDSSNDQAVDFPLTGVIPGFSEGIAMMPMGSTYELYIPGNLAYGERGVPGVIAPNELLIFEVELVDIK